MKRKGGLIRYTFVLLFIILNFGGCAVNEKSKLSQLFSQNQLDETLRSEETDETNQDTPGLLKKNEAGDDSPKVKPVFVCDLQITDIRLSHTDFEADFFTNNDFSIKKFYIRLCTDTTTETYGDGVQVVQLSSMIDHKSLICNINLITDTIEIVIKNYDNQARFSFILQIESEALYPSIYLTDNTTSQLTATETGYTLRHTLPYMYQNEQLGSFVIEADFITKY